MGVFVFLFFFNHSKKAKQNEKHLEIKSETKKMKSLN